jgi:hypothetical protein
VPAAAAEVSTSNRPQNSDMDDDEFGQMSLTTIEAELKPKVVRLSKKSPTTTRSAPPAGAGHFQPAAERTLSPARSANTRAEGRNHHVG